MYLIGLMSGTSVDGIDVALVEFSSVRQLKVVQTHFTEFPAKVRDAIRSLAATPIDQALCQSQTEKLNTELAELYAKASNAVIEKSGLDSNQIAAIANHGQTVRHCPDAQPGYSIQLGNGQQLANLTNLKTIDQFRQADLALGGQGAPLMPAFHQAVLAGDGTEDAEKSKLVLNIGGIANLTQLNSPVVGFDTGPGNVLMDQWIQAHTGKSYDAAGEYAASGQVNERLLDTLLSHPYFTAPFPKSTGTETFNMNWLLHVEPTIKKLQPEDVQATLCALTAQTIASGVAQLTVGQPLTGKLYLCGGGTHNQHLVEQLSLLLPSYEICSTQQIGLDPDWVEAAGFAWLGYCHLNGIPSNLPSVTGASEQVVLGRSYLPQN